MNGLATLIMRLASAGWPRANPSRQLPVTLRDKYSDEWDRRLPPGPDDEASPFDQAPLFTLEANSGSDGLP